LRERELGILIALFLFLAGLGAMRTVRCREIVLAIVPWRCKRRKRAGGGNRDCGMGFASWRFWRGFCLGLFWLFSS